MQNLECWPGFNAAERSRLHVSSKMHYLSRDRTDTVVDQIKLKWKHFNFIPFYEDEKTIYKATVFLCFYM